MSNEHGAGAGALMFFTQLSKDLQNWSPDEPLPDQSDLATNFAPLLEMASRAVEVLQGPSGAHSKASYDAICQIALSTITLCEEAKIVPKMKAGDRRVL